MVAASQVIRGHLLWRAGNLESAKVAYRMVTDSPNTLPWQQATVATRLGRLYAAEGFSNNALRFYDRAISQHPQMATYVNKAHLLAQLGRHTEALGLYRQAVQIAPDHPLARVLLHYAEQREQQKTHLSQRVTALLGAIEKRGIAQSASDQLTLAFLTVQRPDSLAPQAGEELYLIDGITQALRDSGRIQVVEPALLVRLLAELKLSAAALADPGMALRVGRILAAQLLATGIIVRDRDEEILSLTLTETATGTIRAQVKIAWRPEALRRIVEELVPTLLSQVHPAYAVRGQISAVHPQMISMQNSAEPDVTPGLTMQILENAEPGR